MASAKASNVEGLSDRRKVIGLTLARLIARGHAGVVPGAMGLDETRSDGIHGVRC